jgi:hypothetical protein
VLADLPMDLVPGRVNHVVPRVPSRWIGTPRSTGCTPGFNAVRSGHET